MKKSNLIALAVTLTLATGVACAATNYSDVSGNWAQSDINTMVDMKVMNGFNDGNFHPDAWLTRAEFTQMAGKTLGLEAKKADTVPSFKQVSKNNLGFGNVDNQQWISDYPSGVFRPANPVRRAEALAALGGALNKPLVSETEANDILSKYSDADQVPANARRQVATAISNNMFAIEPTSGTDKIEPLRPLTRAEAAVLLNDLYQNRDIAIVQNGQVVANNSQGAENMNASDTSTTGTSAVSGAYGTEDENQSTTTSTAATTAPKDMKDQDKDTPQQQIGYNQLSSDQIWLGHSSLPYRASSDTIPEFRTVNTTTAPTTLASDTTVNLPANTVFTGTVAKAIYSEYNHPGDPVMLILDHPLFDTNGKIVAPAGSKVLGYVNNVISRNRTNDNAQLGITFNGLVTPTGQRIPINATIANAEGILKAQDLQGVVFHPDHSTAALKREINASEGSYYGIKQGKMWIMNEPMVQQVSSEVVDPMDIRSSNIVLGVGDRLQLRMEDMSNNNNINNANDQTEGSEPTSTQ